MVPSAFSELCNEDFRERCIASCGKLSSELGAPPNAAHYPSPLLAILYSSIITSIAISTY